MWASTRVQCWWVTGLIMGALAFGGCGGQDPEPQPPDPPAAPPTAFERLDAALRDDPAFIRLTAQETDSFGGRHVEATILAHGKVGRLCRKADGAIELPLLADVAVVDGRTRECP